MKTIGLIGGMSWESSDLYYQQINRKVQRELGGLHSAKVVLYSVDFHEIEQLQSLGKWDEAGQKLGDIAAKLQSMGVDAVGLCTNTMHLCAEQITQRLNIPFLHIAEALAEKLTKDQKS